MVISSNSMHCNPVTRLTTSQSHQSPNSIFIPITKEESIKNKIQWKGLEPSWAWGNFRYSKDISTHFIFTHLKQYIYLIYLSLQNLCNVVWIYAIFPNTLNTFGAIRFGTKWQDKTIWRNHGRRVCYKQDWI